MASYFEGRLEHSGDPKGVLLRAYEGQDGDALAALITDHIPLAARIAHEHKRTEEEVEELLGVAVLALCEAAETFDYERDRTFGTWAAIKVRGAVKNHKIRLGSGPVRVSTTRAGRKLVSHFHRLEGLGLTTAQIAAELKVSEEDVEAIGAYLSCSSTPVLESIEDDSPNPEEALIAAEERASAISSVRAFGERLTGNRRAVFFGYLLAEDPPTEAELGEQLGVTQQAVSRIKQELIREMKVELSRKGVQR